MTVCEEISAIKLLRTMREIKAESAVGFNRNRIILMLTIFIIIITNIIYLNYI